MPLPKPQSALIFNNYVGDTDEVSKIVTTDGKNINVLAVIGDFYYDFSNTNIGKQTNLKKENYQKLLLDTAKSPINAKSFPENLVVAGGKINTQDLYSLYNKDFFTLISSNISLDLAEPEQIKDILPFASVLFINDLPLKQGGNYEKFLSAFLLYKDENSDLFKTVYANTGRYDQLKINEKTIALLDYLFYTKDNTTYSLPYLFSRTPEVIQDKAKLITITKDAVDTRPIKKIDGIYKNNFLNNLKNLIDFKRDYSFDFHNILLKQNDTETSVNIVSPTKFYEKYIKLGLEPKVPNNSNENQILSFYNDSFTKYDGRTFNEETFLYNGVPFPEFETEAILLSTLTKKTSKYQDFDKPYAAVEFFANSKTDENYNISKVYNQYKDKIELRKYLKRFVVDNESLNSNNTNNILIKNGTVKALSSYTSAEKNLNIINSVFEKNIPAGNANDNVLDQFSEKYSEKLSDVTTLGKYYSYYDIVGYVITKSKGDKIIKRFYILDDTDGGYNGPIRYFDSQIIESAQTSPISYSYKVEQINNIFGREYKLKTIENLEGDLLKQKDLFKSDNTGKTIEEAVQSNLINAAQNSQNFVTKENEINLPFYKNKPLNVSLKFVSNKKELISYSPIFNQKTESPDIELSTEIFNTPPSTPDIKIYSKKGESKDILIVLSNLISKKIEATGIENKVNVIDLGASIKQQQFTTKEFRVFRTEDKPTSYASFSKTPRKILDPNFPDFVDPIEPNTTYYYYADAVDSKDTPSLPSKVLKFQMVEEQSHIFPLLEVYDFGEDKELITEKIFKKNIKISPTFLQSAVGPKGAVGEYISQNFNNGYTNKLFDTSKNILDTTLNPTHKIRVTSKKTRRRFDINTIFSYEYVKDFKSVPDDAILVLEEEKKIGGLGSQCLNSSDCGSGLFCKDAPPAGQTAIIKFGKCSSVEEVKGFSEEIFGKTGKCDIGETLDSFLAGLSGAGGASFLIAIIVGGLFTKAAEKVKTKQECDNIAPLIIKVLEEDPEFEKVPQDSKDAVKKSLEGKVIKGKFTS